MKHEIPLLEFDPERNAILNPHHILQTREGFPACAVICFFHDVLAELRDRGEAEQTGFLTSEAGPNPILTVEFEGRPVAVIQPGIGAPMAAFVLEELIALGAKRVVACGGAGVLDPEVAVGHLVVPTSAIRDEGTSYHYLPASREVAPDPAMLAAIERTLRRRKVDYRLAKTWTIDAIYRETRAKVEIRRLEGCATVEMEAAALFAVGQFRGVPVGQILYGGDDVSGFGDWDPRGWDKHIIREQLFWLAVESCVESERGGREDGKSL
jgi:purine-nucleoside phosphorylase